MAFEWDAAKNRANIRKHGIDFADAARIFDGLVLERVDDRFDYGEERVVAVGEVEGRTVLVVYSRRGGDRRIISARKASRNERQAYRAIFP